MKPQKRTAAFIRFKEKHTALSDLYWGVHFALDTTASTLSTEKDRTKKIAAIIPPTFEAKRLDVTLGESDVLFPAYLARTRVFLLLAAAANLEAYLKEIIVVDVLSKGFGTLPDSLSAAGEALAAPIIDSNSLMPQLKYARDYFNAPITEEVSKWGEYYKIRSNMAHVGGFVTARTLRDLPNQGLKIGEVIHLTWEQLKNALKAAFDIADQIDRKAFCQGVWDAEFFREAEALKSQKLLMKSYIEFKRYTHEAYGIAQISRKVQNRVKFSYFGIT